MVAIIIICFCSPCIEILSTESTNVLVPLIIRLPFYKLPLDLNEDPLKRSNFKQKIESLLNNTSYSANVNYIIASARVVNFGYTVFNNVSATAVNYAPGIKLLPHKK